MCLTVKERDMSDGSRKPAKPDADASPREDAEASRQEDDLQRRFREALERKQATAGRHPHAEGGQRRGAGPASNEKVRRQFRRKSG
jgi:hypothetical protein